MILYQLTCGAGHHFDAWFKDSATYTLQAARGEIVCPLCGDTRIRKAPMAPRIVRHVGSGQPEQKHSPTPQPGSATERHGAATSLEKDVPATGTPGSGATDGLRPDSPSAPPVPLPDALQTALLSRLHTALRELRQEVEARCDYVGERFADEARRIHYGETDPRGIYGEASSEEVEELHDEGIALQQIPWLPRNHS